MSRAHGRRGLVLAVAVVLLLIGVVPLLRANEARQQAVWEHTCVGSGGSVTATPAARDNPLVVQLARPTYECRSVAGALVSVRD